MTHGWVCLHCGWTSDDDLDACSHVSKQYALVDLGLDPDAGRSRSTQRPPRHHQ